MTNGSPTADVQQVVETSPNGRYIRYSSVLGKGAYKTVYEAFDTEEALQVAWNKLHVDRLSEHDLEKVSNEVSLLAKVTHKNIIKFYDSWRGVDSNGNQTINFITEQMMSGTLKEYLRKAQAIKLKVIRRWCSNILDAIAYLHTQTPPIMHRDLKCDNIFINGHVGEVKIGDLGLSGVKEREKADSVIGTPEFMAPELYEESYTEKVDIYAFGMCLLEIVSMEYPYSECTNMAQIFKKVFGGEKPRAFEMLMDGDVKEVIAACLQREPLRPSAVELRKHPLFSDWDTDDGNASNLSLVKNSPENTEVQQVAQQVAQADLHIGTDLIDWSDPLKRHMLVRMEEGENGGGDENQVSVRASNQNGGFVVGLEIPIRDAIKRVEFTFDPFEDSARHIAQEMVAEFGLGEEQLVVIQEEVERQVKMANDQRCQREALSRNVTPQATPRNTETQHPRTSIHSSNVAGTILEDATMPLQPPQAQQATTSHTQSHSAPPISQSMEHQRHASMQGSALGTSEHSIVDVVPSFPDGRSINPLPSAADDQITREHFDIPSAPHHRQENVIVTSSQDIFLAEEPTVDEGVESHVPSRPPEKPTSLSLPPSVPDYSDEISKDNRQKPNHSEVIADEDLADRGQDERQETIPVLIHPHQSEGHQASHQQVEQQNDATLQTPSTQPIQEQIVQQQAASIPVPHSVAPLDPPSVHSVVYEGTRETSFSSRSELGTQDCEREIASDVLPLSASQIAQAAGSQQTSSLTSPQDEQFVQAQNAPVNGNLNSGTDLSSTRVLRRLTADDIATTATDIHTQTHPQGSSFVRSRPQSSNSVEIPPVVATSHVSQDFNGGHDLTSRPVVSQSNPIEDRNERLSKSSPHKDNLEAHIPRDVDSGRSGYVSNPSLRGNEDDVRPVEIRRIATESTSTPALFMQEVEASHQPAPKSSFRSNGFPRTLSERPVSSPPVEHALQITSIPQSISEGNLPRPPSDIAEIPGDAQDHLFNTQSPSIERLQKQMGSPVRASPYPVAGTETEAMSQAVLSRPGADMYSFSVHPLREGEPEGQRRRGASQIRTRSGSRPQIVVVDSETVKPRREANGSNGVQERSNPDSAFVAAPTSSDQGDSFMESYSSPERHRSMSVKSGRIPSNGHLATSSQLALSEDSPPWASSSSSHGAPNGNAGESYGQRIDADVLVSAVDQQNYTDCLKLIDLCSKGLHDEVLEKIESGLASVKFADYDRRTPLHIAAAEGHTSICTLLIERGADVNAKDRWGHTPLWDAKMNGHRNVQELLLRHNGTDNSFSMDVTSFELMQFAAKGDLEAVRDRIVAGAKATFQDYDRRTPLHLACSEGHVEVAELLLVNGASHSARDRVGRSPVDDAVTNGHRKILCVLRQYGATIPPHLLEAQPESVNQKGMDLVEHAARGRADAVRQYLKQGANPNFGDYDHRTPLHLACVEGRHEVVRILLQAGANIHLRDRWGSTPLDEARKGGYTSIVEEIRAWDRKTEQQSTVSVEHSTVVTRLDGPIAASSQEDLSSLDHMSHDIPTSVSMGAIPSLHITPDDFAAKYHHAEDPNSHGMEHAPPLSVPQSHLVPVEVLQAGMTGGPMDERTILRHSRHSDGDIGEARSSVVVPSTSQSAGDFRLAYVSMPNGSTGEHDPTRYAIVQRSRGRGSPVGLSSRRMVGADRYDFHDSGEGHRLGPNGQANSAVRLLVDGLIEAAVSER
ncbi:Serine/threonine protein kinase [Gracilaria domingensis]|nr:Serine/threonine protein kinase [Gracilaria domingensis]